MKNSKLRRVLMLVSCAVMIVCLSVGATLAYLTAQTGPVNNTFTVGKVSFGDKLGNALDEALVDQYGVPQKQTKDDDGNVTKTEPVIAVKDATRVTENTYKLVPGHNYTKDPTVHIGADSEDGWLFVRVQNGIADIEATGDTTIAAQMTAKGWVSVNDDNYPDVYYYSTKVSANADIIVFESFTLKTDADVSGYDDKTIVIQAYLVQADGFENALAAWTNAPLAAWKVTSTTTEDAE